MDTNSDDGSEQQQSDSEIGTSSKLKLTFIIAHPDIRLSESQQQRFEGSESGDDSDFEETELQVSLLINKCSARLV